MTGPLHPTAQKMSDQGLYGISNFHTLANMKFEDQEIFRYHAWLFKPVDFRKVVTSWKHMSDALRKALIGQIIKDVNDGYEEWYISGGRYDADEQDEHEEMVKHAHIRVLRFIHKMKVALPNDME